MQRTTRRLAATAITTLVAAGAVAAGAQAAPAQSASGNVTSGPFSFTFDAQRAADAPPTAATGTFSATTSLGNAKLMTIKGDVTCLDVRGNRIGLFYPVQSSDPDVFSKLGAGVYISLTVDGNGHAKSVQFLPLLVDHVSSCAPIPTIVPAQGPATAGS